jgi:hypothetical protein
MNATRWANASPMYMPANLDRGMYGGPGLFIP